jgi:AcrR family transcriptional regulator
MVLAARVGPRTKPRLPLSRDRVLRAAIAIADASGIESLTMRNLAQELGVEAMTLYHYVAKKEDLLAGIVDIVVAEIEPPAAGGDWKVAMRRSAISAHDVLKQHPWACTLMMSPNPGIRPGRLRYMDSVLGRLREAGFSAEMTHHAYHALDSHIMGFTLWAAGISSATRHLPEQGAAFLRQLAVGAYPHFVEHVEYHLRPAKRRGRKSEFEFGLDLILDGLDQIRTG